MKNFFKNLLILFGVFIFLKVAIADNPTTPFISDALLTSIEKKYGDFAKRRVIAWQKIIKDNQKKPHQKN